MKLSSSEGMKPFDDMPCSENPRETGPATNMDIELRFLEYEPPTASKPSTASNGRGGRQGVELILSISSSPTGPCGSGLGPRNVPGQT